MRMAGWMRASVVLAACVVALCFAADEPKEAPGDAAWADLLKALRPPPPPAEWRTNQPTKEQIAAYEKNNGGLAGKAAEKAKAFYTQYPDHAKAQNAREMEPRLLTTAIALGATDFQAQLDALEESRLRDPKVSAQERLNLRIQRILQTLNGIGTSNRLEKLQKAERGVRELKKDFPTEEDVQELFLRVADSYLDEDISKARALTEEVATSASGDVREQANAQLRRLAFINKPLDLEFTDLSGKDIKMQDYRGKVIVLDFWATWCGPCVAAMPEMKGIYAKYHAKGLDIIGISLDKEKEKLDEFVSKQELAWPQHFDGFGWESKMAQKFEIAAIPAVWIVDKKGVVRDINGRQSLAAKIERFLSEE